MARLRHTGIQARPDFLLYLDRILPTSDQRGADTINWILHAADTLQCSDLDWALPIQHKHAVAAVHN